MGIITYAQEIMYLAIALSVLLVASGITWVLYIFVSLARDVRTVVSKLKDIVTSAQETLTTVKQKIGDTSVQFKFLFEGMKTILQWINSRAELKSSKSDQDQTDEDEA